MLEEMVQVDYQEQAVLQVQQVQVVIMVQMEQVNYQEQAAQAVQQVQQDL